MLAVGDAKVASSVARVDARTIRVALPHHTSYMHRFKHHDDHGGAQVLIDGDGPIGEPSLMLLHGQFGPTIMLAAPLDDAYRVIEIGPDGQVARDRTFSLPPGGHDERELQFTIDHDSKGRVVVYGRPTTAARETTSIPAFVDHLDWANGRRRRHRDVPLAGHFSPLEGTPFTSARQLPTEAAVGRGRVSYSQQQQPAGVAVSLRVGNQRRWTTSLPVPGAKPPAERRVATGGSDECIISALWTWPSFGADIYVLDAASGEIVEHRKMQPPEFWAEGDAPVAENGFAVAQYEGATIFSAGQPHARYDVAFESATGRWLGTNWALE